MIGTFVGIDAGTGIGTLVGFDSVGTGIGTVVVIGTFVGIDAGSASLNRAAAARIRSCGLCRTGVV